MSITLPRHPATRYVQPLREGGSLPAVVDTDAGGLYVAKFRGAGQGAKVLVAEIIAHGIATSIGLPVPELAIIDLPDRFGQSEPDPEIQDLLKASRGINIGLRYLDGAFNFDPVAAHEVVDGPFAAQLVWFDAFITNPDRTARNPNLMVWQRKPWLIDHGAALYMHYDWPSVTEERVATPFPLTKQHVLLLRSGDIEAAGHAAVAALKDDVLGAIIDSVPDELLMDPVTGDESPDAATARARYVSYLSRRRDASPTFVAAAVEARDALRASPSQPYPARR
ncbi:MAG: aminotransferase class I and II [Gemmatimonadaceae bacterium]|nr:aminotransferase class I and II [Gemmatimonadaceae bacterium]